MVILIEVLRTSQEKHHARGGLPKAGVWLSEARMVLLTEALQSSQLRGVKSQNSSPVSCLLTPDSYLLSPNS